VSKLAQEHRKVYKRKKEMKIVMRLGTFVNYFWTKFQGVFEIHSKKLDKRSIKVGPRV
jgi:hypothetical protein